LKTRIGERGNYEQTKVKISDWLLADLRIPKEIGGDQNPVILGGR
jgi:hypothetical protein